MAAAHGLMLSLAGVSVALIRAFHARSKRPDLIRARKVRTACPPTIRQRMPERFMRCVTRVLLAASTTPDAARVALLRSMVPCRGAVAQPPRVRRADAPVGTGPVRVKPEDDRLAALGGAQLSRPEYPSQSPTHHADTKISPIILKCSVSITPREKSGAIPGAVSGSVKNRSFFGRPPRALDSVSRDTE